MEMCNCENGEHFDTVTVHDYLGVPAGTQTMPYIGRVCDECKENCGEW